MSNWVIDEFRISSIISSNIIIIGLLFYWNLDILAWIIIKAVIIGSIVGILGHFLFSSIEKYLKKCINKFKARA